MVRRIKLPAVEGLPAGSAAGKTGIFTCPIGKRYKQIDIVYNDGATAGAFKTIIGDIVVLRNDKAFRTHTATELGRSNSINGSQYDVQANGTAGTDRQQMMSNFFFEPWRKNIGQADQFCLNADFANGFRSLQVKVTLASAMSATGSVEAWAVIEDNPLPPPSNGPIDGETGKPGWPVRKIYRTSLTASGAKTEFGTANFPNRDLYQSIILTNPSGTGVIQYVTIRYNGSSGLPLYDKVSQYENIAYLTGRGMNPSTSTAANGFAFDAVFDAADPVQDAVPASENGLWMEVIYTTAAAGTGNMTAIVERIGALE